MTDGFPVAVTLSQYRIGLHSVVRQPTTILGEPPSEALRNQIDGRFVDPAMGSKAPAPRLSGKGDEQQSRHQPDCNQAKPIQLRGGADLLALDP